MLFLPNQQAKLLLQKKQEVENENFCCKRNKRSKMKMSQVTAVLLVDRASKTRLFFLPSRE